MPKDMPERMSEHMPERMSEDMPERMSEDVPERMSEVRKNVDMPERMSEDMPERMSERPQLPAPDWSVPRPTSTASSGRQCSPPDFDRQFRRAVFPAGPQP